MAVRPSDGLPKPFSGDPSKNPLGHWYAFENYLKIQKVENDRGYLDAFKLTLCDDALIWVVDNTDTFQNKEDLKNKFLDQFSGNVTRQGKTVKFRNLKLMPNETVQSFASKIRSLGNRLGQSAESQLDQFMLGLPHQITMGVSISNPKDLSAAAATAEKLTELSPSLTKEVTFMCEEQDTKAEIAELKELIMSLKIDRTSSDKSGQQDRSRGRSPSYKGNDRDHSREGQGRSGSRERGRQDSREIRYDSRGRGGHYGRGRGGYYGRGRGGYHSRGRAGYYQNNGYQNNGYQNSGYQNSRSQQSFPGNCHRCGKVGHKAYECGNTVHFARQESEDQHF